MALIFPVSPTDGQTYLDTDTNRTFKYSSATTAWEPLGDSSAPVFITDLPTNPNQGQILYDAAKRTISVYKEDTSAWEVVSAPPTAIWDVTADGTSNYLFSGTGFVGTETDPTITVVRGQTYTITNTMGIHPFRIQSTQGVGGVAYNDGVINNSVSNGTLVWEVRMDSPSTLYYQCTSHPAMSGTINVLEASSGSSTDYSGYFQNWNQYNRPDGSPAQDGDLITDPTAWAKNAESYAYAGDEYVPTHSVTLEGAGAPTITTRSSGYPLIENDLYIDETAGTLYRYDGSAWQELGGGGGAVAVATPQSTGTVLGYTYDPSTTLPNGTTFLGYDAGNTTLTGYGNTVVGTGSGDNLTSGGENTVVGFGSGTELESGFGNVCVGSNSFGGETVGSANIAIGSLALNGNNNNAIIAIGRNSGQNINNSSENIFLGSNAGRNIGSGSSNMFLGVNSGESITGSSITIIGSYRDSTAVADGTLILARNNSTGTDSVLLRINENNAYGVPTATSGISVNYGTAGQVLTSQGTTSPPTWAAASGGGSTPIATPSTYGTVKGETYYGTHLGWNAGGSADNSGPYVYGNTFIGMGAGAFVNNHDNLYIGSESGYDSPSTTTKTTIIGSHSGAGLVSGDFVLAPNGNNGTRHTQKLLQFNASGSVGVPTSSLGSTVNYGTSGQVLTSKGDGLPPAWEAAGGGGGSYYMGMTGEGGPGTRPDGSTLVVGDHFVDNSVFAKNVENYWWSGSAWLSSSNVIIEGSGAPSSTSRFTGAALVENDFYIDETNAALYRWDSSAWQLLGGGGVNTDGSSNTWAGTSSSIITGAGNTAYGANALNATTDGDNNTAIGSQTLNVNTTGNDNISVGSFSLYQNTTGSFNVAVGPRSLFSNVGGQSNVCIGYQAGYSNTGGLDNVAVGQNALYFNTLGTHNFAGGSLSLYENTTGSFNCATGFQALRFNTEGGYNVAVGAVALLQNTVGEYNVGVGLSALENNTQGIANTAVGAGTLQTVTTGSGNIGIGHMDSTGTSSPVVSLTTEDNTIVFGHTAITNAYIQAAWTVVSDARDKMNFAPVPHGLDFVNQLEPTAYQFKIDRDTETPNGDVRYGFKAQDILALEGDNPVIVNAKDPDHLRYTGENLVPVLVNAVQELTSMVKDLQSEVAALKGE